MSRAVFGIALFGLAFCANGLAASDLTSQTRQAVSAYVERRFAGANREVVVELPALEKRLRRVARDAGEVRVLPYQEIRRGGQVLKCGLFRNGQAVQSFNVRVRVRTFERVLVARRDLARHTVLQDSHVVLERRETTYLNAPPVVDAAGLFGRRTTRYIPAGEILTQKMLEPVPVVRKGHAVTVRFIKNGLEITLPGLAREDGRPGEEIRVKCPPTRRTFKAAVLDSVTVLVRLQ